MDENQTFIVKENQSSVDIPKNIELALQDESYKNVIDDLSAIYLSSKKNHQELQNNYNKLLAENIKMKQELDEIPKLNEEIGLLHQQIREKDESFKNFTEKKAKEFKQKYQEAHHVSKLCSTTMNNYVNNFVNPTFDMLEGYNEEAFNVCQDIKNSFNVLLDRHKIIMHQNKLLNQRCKDMEKEISVLKEKIGKKDEVKHNLMENKKPNHLLPVNRPVTTPTIVHNVNRSIFSSPISHSTPRQSPLSNESVFVFDAQPTPKKSSAITRVHSIVKSNTVNMNLRRNGSVNSNDERATPKFPSRLRSDINSRCSTLPGRPTNSTVSRNYSGKRIPSKNERYPSLYYGGLKCDSKLQEKNEQIETLNKGLPLHMRSCYNPSRGTYDEGLKNVNQEKPPITPKALNKKV